MGVGVIHKVWEFLDSQSELDNVRVDVAEMAEEDEEEGLTVSKNLQHSMP